MKTSLEMKGLCRFCDKIITEKDKWRMVKGGEPQQEGFG